MVTTTGPAGVCTCLTGTTPARVPAPRARVAMLVGFWLATRLPVGLSIALYLAIEIVLALVIRDNLLHKMTDDDFDAVIDTHLSGTFLSAQAAQQLMVAEKSGKMVLI